MVTRSGHLHPEKAFLVRRSGYQLDNRRILTHPVLISYYGTMNVCQEPGIPTWKDALGRMSCA